ncbi:unnamed protein product [Paramecium pentaurelia]|uniref:Uncharacterized protein n=1 Tax=Paramecium pentaurelia TaxID=43138 RepID=A0A8S1Y9M0_9CILI|nr:unnamed protein product [Paramecium pentaurelia]
MTYGRSIQTKVSNLNKPYNDQALILLNQLKNKELTQIDKLILEYTFKEWENLMVLKDFLMNGKNDNIHFTFGFYLKFKLGCMDPYVNTPSICKFYNFLILSYFIYLL